MFGSFELSKWVYENPNLRFIKTRPKAKYKKKAKITKTKTEPKKKAPRKIPHFFKVCYNMLKTKKTGNEDSQPEVLKDFYQAYMIA